jgi:hypothetical protein
MSSQTVVHKNASFQVLVNGGKRIYGGRERDQRPKDGHVLCGPSPDEARGEWPAAKDHFLFVLVRAGEGRQDRLA